MSGNAARGTKKQKKQDRQVLTEKQKIIIKKCGSGAELPAGSRAEPLVGS